MEKKVIFGVHKSLRTSTAKLVLDSVWANRDNVVLRVGPTRAKGDRVRLCGIRGPYGRILFAGRDYTVAQFEVKPVLKFLFKNGLLTIEESE